MALSVSCNSNIPSQTIKGFFKYGRQTSKVIDFDVNTDMACVNGHIYNQFNHLLPGAFKIQFYSCEAKRVVTLDTDLIQSENNPFRSNTIDYNQVTVNIQDYIQFMIEEQSPCDVRNNSENNALIDMLTTDELDNAIVDESFLDELDEARLALTATLNSLNQAMSANHDATNSDNDEGDLENISTLSKRQMESQNLVASSNDYQLGTETNDEINNESERIKFSHDVHPEERDRYLTDRFKVKGESTEKGGLCYLQGFKTQEEIVKKRQILPHLLIPLSLRSKNELILVLYAVYEEQLLDGTRIWFKNPDKGFLRKDQLKVDAEFSNPIPLVLTKPQWTIDGDYALEIYLLTKRDKKLKEPEEVYRVSKGAINRIHSAEHIQSPKKKPLKITRIICVPKIGNQLDWSAFGISNFIQPPTKKPKAPPVTIGATVPTTMSLMTVGSNLPSVPILVQRIFIPSGNLNGIVAEPIEFPPRKRRKN